MQGNVSAIVAVLLIWQPLVVVLFRRLGERVGTLIAIVGGTLILPTVAFKVSPAIRIEITQRGAIGLAVLLGMLATRGRQLFPIRLRWIDLPICLYAIYPLLAILTAGPLVAWDALDLTIQRLLGTLVPYLAARLYFGDPEGAKEISVAIVLASLAYVPICMFEAIMGPRWYLGGLVFGVHYQETMIERLGGYRPEGLFLNGLTLATWIALSAVVACWLWLSGAWRPKRGPAWWPTLVLVVTSIGCRGVYGYLTLLAGLVTVVLTQRLRTRIVIVLLLLVAPSYLALRITGLWDARGLTRVAALTDRASTVEFRLNAEDWIVPRVLSTHPIVGFGNHFWNYQEIGQTISYWPDGAWLLLIWTGGLLGLTLYLAAMELVPASLLLASSSPSNREREYDSPITGLLILIALNAMDSLHNNAMFTPVALAIGSMVGCAPARKGSATDSVTDRPGSSGDESFRREETHTSERAQRQTATSSSSTTSTEAVPRLLCALACVLYIFGHARVEGYEVVKLVGGLGAVLLFAAAGWAGDWASERFVLSKIATFAGLFALFGVSFNLALYPTRSVWTSDILQGLALSGLSMACWRKITDGRAWSYAVLGVAPLIVHFLLTPFLPEVPGSQFFYVESPLSPSLFPLNPWLVFAVLGAWVRNESQPITLGAAAIFGAATAIACLSDPGLTWPVKIPMNLSYAFLGCSVVTLAVALIRASMQWELVSRALGWLGGNWLVFFYLQFALVAILSRSPVRSAEGTWTILAIGTLAATWLSVAIASPSTAFFRRPAPWLILLGMILGVALWPGLSRNATTGVAGIIGLVFATQAGSLARVVLGVGTLTPVERPRSVTKHASPTSRPTQTFTSQENTRRDLAVNLARFAAVVFLLASPELLRLLTRDNPVAQPANPRSEEIAPADTPPNKDDVPTDQLNEALEKVGSKQSPPR